MEKNTKKYSYILKKDTKDKHYFIVKRVNGSIETVVPVYNEKLVIELHCDALVDRRHSILHYAECDCERLNKLILELKKK